MSYFLVKANLKRGQNAKVKKESFVVKASNIIFAEAKVTSELTPVDSEVKVTDVNLKNYTDVFITADNTGPFFEIVVEFDDIDGKVIKEIYLQQSYSTKEAEETLMSNLNGEVKSVKETNIVDYFETV